MVDSLQVEVDSHQASAVGSLQEAVDTHQEEAVDTRPEEVADTRQEGTEEVTLQEDMEEAVATNKCQLVTQDRKVPTSTLSSCTKSKKFCCNKNNSEVADMEVAVMEVTLQAVMEESQAATEYLPQAMALHPHHTAHPAIARAALLELTSATPSKDTKSLST